MCYGSGCQFEILSGLNCGECGGGRYAFCPSDEQPCDICEDMMGKEKQVRGQCNLTIEDMEVVL